MLLNSILNNARHLNNDHLNKNEHIFLFFKEFQVHYKH